MYVCMHTYLTTDVISDLSYCPIVLFCWLNLIVYFLCNLGMQVVWVKKLACTNGFHSHRGSMVDVASKIHLHTALLCLLNFRGFKEYRDVIFEPARCCVQIWSNPSTILPIKYNYKDWLLLESLKQFFKLKLFFLKAISSDVGTITSSTTAEVTIVNNQGMLKGKVCG